LSELPNKQALRVLIGGLCGVESLNATGLLDLADKRSCRLLTVDPGENFARMDPYMADKANKYPQMSQVHSS
jgi:hypothetical protein